MKSIKLILLYSLIISSPFCQTAPKSNFNFGFENTNKKDILPDNWIVWGTKDYSVKTDSLIKHSGKNSVLIESGDNKMNNF